MAVWSHIKFFWDTMLGSVGSTLQATSTASGDYSVNYIYNMLETNMWKANAYGTSYILYDAGAGATKTADYFIVGPGHNLHSAAATISLQYFDAENATISYLANGTYTAGGAIKAQGNNAPNAYLDAITPFSPPDDRAVLREFTLAGAVTNAHRIWRVQITGAVLYPYLTLCVWGNKTDLDYASSGFDPYEQEVKAVVNLSQGGYVAGVHTQYTERSLSLRFEDADSTLYGKVKAWWDASGLKNFFVAWESANSPADIFLMRPDTRFSNPLKAGGLYRDITINLKGRKE